MSFLDRESMSEPIHKAMRAVWDSPISGAMYAIIDLMWQNHIKYEDSNAEWSSWLDQVWRATKDCKDYQEAATCAKATTFRANPHSSSSIVLFGLTDLMIVEDWEALLCYCEVHCEAASQANKP